MFAIAKLSMVSHWSNLVYSGRPYGNQWQVLLRAWAWLQWAKMFLHQFLCNQPIGLGTVRGTVVFIGLTLSWGSWWSHTQVHHQLWLVEAVAVTDLVLYLASWVWAERRGIQGGLHTWNWGDRWWMIGCLLLMLGVCAPLVVFDTFLLITSACFLSGFVTWLVAIVLHCYSLFALFVDLKFSCPVSFLFSLLHWAPGLSSIVFSSIQSLTLGTRVLLCGLS